MRHQFPHKLSPHRWHSHKPVSDIVSHKRVDNPFFAVSVVSCFVICSGTRQGSDREELFDEKVEDSDFLRLIIQFGSLFTLQ